MLGSSYADSIPVLGESELWLNFLKNHSTFPILIKDFTQIGRRLTFLAKNVYFWLMKSKAYKKGQKVCKGTKEYARKSICFVLFAILVTANHEYKCTLHACACPHARNILFYFCFILFDLGPGTPPPPPLCLSTAASACCSPTQSRHSFCWKVGMGPKCRNPV